MGWMKEAAMIIEDARVEGVTLTLADLEREGGSLVVKGGQLPLPVVEIDTEADWVEWLEVTYDPDNERLEDKEV